MGFSANVQLEKCTKKIRQTWFHIPCTVQDVPLGHWEGKPLTKIMFSRYQRDIAHLGTLKETNKKRKGIKKSN